MLYEILASLWDGPGTDAEIAQAIEERTGERFSRQAADRYLRLLRHCGYAHASGDQLTPRYTMTPEGSTLLARMARAVEHTENTVPA